MAQSSSPSLPEGFTLDQPTTPQLPDGFALDTTPQMSGIARAAALPASNFARGAAQTVDSFAPSTFDDPIANTVVTNATGNTDWMAPSNPLSTIAKNAGVTDRADLTPQNTFEKGVASAATGAGRAAPFAIFGAPLMTMGAGGAGGIAGDAAAKAFPNHPALAEFFGNLLGALGFGGALAAGSRLASVPGQAAARAFGGQGAVDAQATNRLADAMQADIDSGAVTAKDFADAHAKGLMPWEVEDAENTRALAGAITRSGGPARTIMRNYARNEDRAAPGRLDDALNTAFGTDASGAPLLGHNGGAPLNINSVSEQIASDQQATAAPLYQKAMTGGSIAPLKDQLGAAVQDATQRMATISAQMKTIAAKGQSGATGVAGAQLKQQYDTLNTQLAAASADRQSALAMFQKAQKDIATNAPGAVWSPYIGRLLENPYVKQGIARGYQIQRNEADGANVPFNPTEYAVTGQNLDGSPVISQVPNMRLLDMAKRGLDAMIGDNTDAVTGKVSDFGRSLVILKKGLVGELDRLNPDYAPARAAWSGPAQSQNAIRMGAAAMSKNPQEIASDLADLSPGDQTLYRLSALQNGVSPKMNAGSLGANEAGRLLANTPDKLKPQLDALLPDDASRQTVLAAAQRANLKKQAMQAISGGSPTIERGMDQLALSGHSGSSPLATAAVGAAGMATHEPVVGMSMIARAIADVMKKRMSVSPAVNKSVAQMLTSPDPNSLAPALSRLGSTPSVLPWWASVPAQSAIASRQPFALAPPQ